MRDEDKTKEQLINELVEMRQRITELKALETERLSAEQAGKRAEEALRESEEKYRTLFETMAQGVVYQAADGRITSANPAAERILGLTLDQMQGRTSMDPRWKAIHEDGSAFPGETHPSMVALKSGKEVRNVVMGVFNPLYDEYRWININAVPQFKSGEDKPYQVYTTFDDITERERAEEALQESEEEYRLLVENATQAIVVAQDGMLKFFNPKLMEIIGYSQEEIASRPFAEFIHPDDLEMAIKYYLECLKGEETPQIYALRVIDKPGNIKWLESNAVLITWEGRPATLNFLTDITERKRAEKQIKTALKEKEVLLQEIHHRVKNNLQVVSSLLDLQLDYIEDKQALKMFQDSQNRIKSMALVHEKLYQSRDLVKIDFADYIRDLTAYLFGSYKVNPDAITLKINVEDVSLNIDMAIPCGLIINELVSNSLKHAFPPEEDGPASQEGEIRIGLYADGDKLILIVSDNGVGLPKDLDFRNTESLGLQLVDIFTDQLEGTIELDRSGGTAFKITFAEPEDKSSLGKG